MEGLLLVRSTVPQPVDGQREWLVDPFAFFRHLLKFFCGSLYNCILHPGELSGCDLSICKFKFRREGCSICSWCPGEDYTSWLQENNQDCLQYERPAIQVPR